MINTTNHKVSIKVYLQPGAKLPIQSSQQAAGWDIFACLPPDSEIIILPGQRILIPTGLYFEIPDSYFLSLRPRSGLAYNSGLIIPNAPATIDSDYRGEVKVLVANIDPKHSITIEHHNRIAQMLLERTVPLTLQVVEMRNELSPTKRDESGFGSTGV